MTIYETVMSDRNLPDANRPLLSLIAGEICIDGKPMGDDAAINRLSQMVKVCNKNIELYKKSENFGEALKEVAFFNLINAYLPKGAQAADIEAAIVATGADKSMKSMGKVMGYLKKNFAVVDGNLVKSVLMGDA